jgi:hypothetical protein
MKRETSIKQRGGSSSQASSKGNSRVMRGDSKLAEQVPSVTRAVKRDSAANLAESANEHMLRAWRSIHKNGKERKAS